VPGGDDRLCERARLGKEVTRRQRGPRGHLEQILPATRFKIPR